MSDPLTPSATAPRAADSGSDSDTCPPLQPPPPPPPHDHDHNQPPPPPPPPPSPPPSPPPHPHPFSYTGPSLLERALRRRRTWVALFLLAYAALISSSWNLLLSIRSWYTAATADPSGSWWLAAAYASAMYGLVFGVLSMAAALAVALPATLVTWITLLVLLAFAGKPRRRLVDDGRKITADIAGVVFKVVVTEGRAVAVACAVMCFFALRRRRREEEGGGGGGGGL